MTLPVVVKSSKRGIHLVLDSEISFEELTDKIKEKFQSSKEFFQDSKFAISFSGRELSNEEQIILIQVISQTCNAEIICVLEDNELLDEYLAQRIEQISLEKQMKSGQFHKGDILAGQTLECENSVIVIGSVYPGGKIISKGNIVILGKLSGYAFAGVSGKSHAYISAFEIDSTQLKIGDFSFQDTFPSLVEIGKRREHIPQIAYAKDKTIIIEPLTKGYLNDI